MRTEKAPTPRALIPHVCDATLIALFQIGAYYGSEINSVDVNGDGITDLLLVGAPMYFSEGRERGKVSVYVLKEVNVFDVGLTNWHDMHENKSSFLLFCFCI